MMRNIWKVVLSATSIAGTANMVLAQGTPPPPRPAFTLTSPAFKDGDILPNKYSELNPAHPVSPPLTWVNAPASAQSFVLIVHDVDVALQRSPLDELHWMAIDIPATAAGLPEGVPPTPTLPDGTIQPNNGGGRGTPTPGFMAPGAPAGKYHHYVFELYALDIKLNLGPQASRDQVLAAIAGHVAGKAALTALFHE
jgi:Raf kinase inhibitor-like YbhB/YbcL family protein